MNNERRKMIAKIQSQLDDLKTELETVKDLEQEIYDNMPDSLQGSEKGDRSFAAITSLEDAISCMEDACTQLDDAVNN